MISKEYLFIERHRNLLILEDKLIFKMLVDKSSIQQSNGVLLLTQWQSYHEIPFRVSTVG